MRVHSLNRTSVRTLTASLTLAAAAAVWPACRGTSSAGPGAPRAAGAPAVVADIARDVQAGRPVIFLGLDAGDWPLLDDYIARGVMPNLGRLVAEGTSGHLKTLSPALSPLIWTTMMTGNSPLEHGILDFVQFDPVSGQKEPITSSERRTPALWNMATAAGKRSAVFGLWATFPAEAINGLVVSDRLFTFLYKEAAPPQGVVFPADREAWARDGLARAERDVNYAALHAYLPWLDGIGVREGRRLRRPVCAAGQRAAAHARRNDRLRRSVAAVDPRAAPGHRARVFPEHRHDGTRVRAVCAAKAAVDRAAGLRALQRRPRAFLPRARRAHRSVSRRRRCGRRRADAGVGSRFLLGRRPADQALERRDGQRRQVARSAGYVSAVGKGRAGQTRPRRARRRSASGSHRARPRRASAGTRCER